MMRSFVQVVLFLAISSMIVAAQHQEPKRENPVGEASLEWLDWKPGLLETYRKKGKIVWLHFHADWCVSCKVNEARVFSNPLVIKKLKRLGVVMVNADLTKPNERFRAELKKYGRDSVPTDVIAPLNPDQKPLLAPEILGVKEVLNLLKIAEKPKEEEA